MMRRILWLSLVVGLVAGCASDQSAQYTRDGQEYGVTDGVFRGRWWSYYERGNSYLAGEYYNEALADFEKALSGRDMDSWRARTYGLHFVEYFPNREIGIAYFHQGNLSQAEVFLTRSLEQIDTERAHIFLDKVKQEQIAKGERQDNTQPDIQMNLADEVILLSEPVFELEIAAADDTGVNCVTVAVETEHAAPAPAPVNEEKPEPIETPAIEADPAPEADVKMAASKAPDLDLSADTETPSEDTPAPNLLEQIGKTLGEFVKLAEETLYQRGSPEQLNLKKDLRLAEGTHLVAVKAQDLANKQTTQKRMVTVDLTGPNIGIFAPLQLVTPDASLTLQGAAADANGVTKVTLDGMPLVDADAESRVEFEQQLDLKDGENNFVLMAKDKAGNETHTAVSIYKGDPASASAKLWVMAKRQPELLQLASIEGNITNLIMSAQAPGSEIVVKSPSADEPYRDNLTMRVSGEVITDTKVAKLTINGEPIDALTGAPRESFNRRIPLDPAQIGEKGTTLHLAIHAEDENGQAISHEMDVKVEPIILDNAETRMPVAVLAFGGQDIAEADATYLRDTTEQQLGIQRRFNMLDRTRLQDVLTEQQLASSLADPVQAIQIGQLINAYVFLVGDVYSRDAKGYEIKVRAISTETSEILEWLDVYIEDKNDRAEISLKCKALAEQLKQKFPRLPGAVTAVNPRSPNEFMLNWTQEDGVREGMPLVLVYETEPVRDETTGEVLWPGEIIEVGRGNISGFMPNGSTRATLKERNEAEDIKIETGLPAFTM